jgi:hypothetical protein
LVSLFYGEAGGPLYKRPERSQIMFVSKNRSRSFGLGLAVIAVGLFVVVPTASAKLVRLPGIHAKVRIPAGWKRVRTKKPGTVKFKMHNGGTYKITHKSKKKPLNLYVAIYKKIAKKNGWKLLEERRNIRLKGNRAHLLVYQMQVKGVRFRLAYFITNTPKGSYTQFFLKQSKKFRKGLYKAVYSTFDTI